MRSVLSPGLSWIENEWCIIIVIEQFVNSEILYAYSWSETYGETILFLGEKIISNKYSRSLSVGRN